MTAKLCTPSGTVAGAPVAQLVELTPFKRQVPGSRPGGGTTFSPDDLPANMWAKVALELCPIASLPGFCWAWTGATNSRGYGCVAVDGKSQLAHRVAYQLLIGPIPDGLEIDHLCRNIICCNPQHGEPVTSLINGRRARADQVRCAHGHPLAGPNLRIKRHIDGYERRECRFCAGSWRNNKSAYPAVERRRAAMLAEAERALREELAS